MLEKLSKAIAEADAIVVGAGAGLSAAAGYDYGDKELKKYFPDFVNKYRFHNLYEASFYPFRDNGEFFAFWSRFIYINRYVKDKKPVYQNLRELLDGKDYFVITTNADHCFQKAGFDKQRLFYTQGDCGLWQCRKPCHQETYDNEENVKACIMAQGFEIDENGDLKEPKNITMTVPENLIPHCPKCGRPMQYNLHGGDWFVQDKGWYLAQERYEKYLAAHQNGNVLYLDLGSGMNTPIIFKYPFMNMTYSNPNATYATINLGEAVTAREIADRSICIDADLNEAIEKLLEMKHDTE